MTAAVKQENEYYTYADVQEWDVRQRWELYDGEAYEMASPNRAHQEVLGALFNQFYTFLRGKHCRVYVAPFGVRLFPKPDNSDDTYFEPDITVVCDSSKLDDKGCNGAPDLVAEVLSPSTANHDLIYKLNKYLKAGVKEYWIVAPEEKTVQVYKPEAESTYRLTAYEADAAVPVSIFPGFHIDLKTVFG